MYWTLSIEKQMRAVDYNDRLKVSRELGSMLARHGVRHQSSKAAHAAAEAISKNPLVVYVAVTRVQEISEGEWRGGLKQREK